MGQSILSWFRGMIAILALCHTTWIASAQSDDLVKARSAYRLACEKPESAALVNDFIRAVDELDERFVDPNFIQGMKATANMMLAESMMNPFEKLEQFTTWKAPLEAAILSNPNHPELRLLRLSIQWKVPFFLNYSSHMEEDINRIKKGLDQSFWKDDSDHTAFIVNFLQHIQDDASE